MAKRREFLSLVALPVGMPLMAARPGLPNMTVQPQDAKVAPAAFGEVRIFFDGSTDQLKSMTAGSVLLKPGTEPHPPHEHPEEEFMLITEGQGEIVVGGKTKQVGPGALMYCAGNQSHGIRNTGRANMTFYFWKWRK